MVRVSNNAELAVTGVRVVVGVPVGGGIREQASYRLDRALAAGSDGRSWSTDLGPMSVGHGAPLSPRAGQRCAPCRVDVLGMFRTDETLQQINGH